MLLLENVSKSFGAKQALAPTSLAPRPGETSVLIGPSGCGKSTLLRLMIGLITPDAGTVKVDGTPLTAANVDQIRHRIGYVIQDGGLFPHLTAHGNVTLLPRHLRKEPAWIEQRVAELAALVRISRETMARYPSGLSGGERQR